MLSRLIAVVGVIILAQPAYGVTVEKKLMQFGGPETRTRCINIKEAEIPDCNIVNWTVRCGKKKMSGCVEWATDIMQHEVFLVASGPDSPDTALETILRSALERAVGAAVTAALATPGELSVKITAAVVAFKLTLGNELSSHAVLNALREQFLLNIRTTSEW